MRKTFLGQVVSDKMARTVVVLVRRKKRHPFYQKVVSHEKRFYADNEKGAKVGDWVKIEETRPISRLKRFKVIKIVKEKR